MRFVAFFIISCGAVTPSTLHELVSLQSASCQESFRAFSETVTGSIAAFVAGPVQTDERLNGEITREELRSMTAAFRAQVTSDCVDEVDRALSILRRMETDLMDEFESQLIYRIEFQNMRRMLRSFDTMHSRVTTQEQSLAILHEYERLYQFYKGEFYERPAAQIDCLKPDRMREMQRRAGLVDPEISRDARLEETIQRVLAYHTERFRNELNRCKSHAQLVNTYSALQSRIMAEFCQLHPEGSRICSQYLESEILTEFPQIGR